VLNFEVIGRYNILVIDLPWHYYGSKSYVGIPGDGGYATETKMAAASKFYPTMSDEEIAALPVRDWLAPKNVVFLWATGPRLDAAINTLQAWDLTFRGVPFTWVKTRKDGKPIGAQGVRPSITKPTTEYVIAASTTRKGRPLPVADEAVPQVVLSPRGAHSAKPEEVQNRIERLYPHASKAEMFARRHRDGWDCYGNELEELGSIPQEAKSGT